MTIHPRIKAPEKTRTVEGGDVFRSLVRYLLELRPDELSRQACKGRLHAIIELEEARIRERAQS